MNSFGAFHCLHISHCTASVPQQPKADLLDSDNICSHYLLQQLSHPLLNLARTLKNSFVANGQTRHTKALVLSFVYVVYLATEMMFLFFIHGKRASLVAGHTLLLRCLIRGFEFGNCQ